MTNAAALTFTLETTDDTQLVHARWEDIAELLGRGCEGTPVDDAVIVAALLVAGAPVWVGRDSSAGGFDESGLDEGGWWVSKSVEPAGCECGTATGHACYGELEDDAVTVEVMPESLRASHEAAGNRGAYPANGAERLRVTPDCADDVIGDADGWASIV